MIASRQRMLCSPVSSLILLLCFACAKRSLHAVDAFTVTTTTQFGTRRNQQSHKEQSQHQQPHRQQACRYLAAAANDYGNALYTQVISDVDDTLKSSGGVNIAGIALGGIDVQYERGEFYPGVAEFMLGISRGITSSRTPPKVAILTARAEEFKLALELKDDSSLAVAFRSAGENVGISGWGLGPVLYGSVAEWIVQDRKGLRKFTNFEQLLRQDPTTGGMIMDYVYVGDTGELDQEAGETMLREYPMHVKAVFLHCVSDVPGGNVPVPPCKLINGRPLIFFRTYVGAAVAALQLELLAPSSLQRVMEAACAKLEDEARSSDKWLDLIQDLELARDVLKQRC